MDKVSFYQDSNGEKVSRTTSHKAVVFIDGRLLTVVNEYSGELCIPGGRQQVDEQPIDTLTREIREEIGCGTLRILSATLIHESEDVFRWHEDGMLRHIDRKWHLCQLDPEGLPPIDQLSLLDRDAAIAALNRESQVSLLTVISDYFK